MTYLNLMISAFFFLLKIHKNGFLKRKLETLETYNIHDIHDIVSCYKFYIDIFYLSIYNLYLTLVKLIDIFIVYL